MKPKYRKSVDNPKPLTSFGKVYIQVPNRSYRVDIEEEDGEVIETADDDDGDHGGQVGGGVGAWAPARD